MPHKLVSGSKEAVGSVPYSNAPNRSTNPVYCLSHAERLSRWITGTQVHDAKEKMRVFVCACVCVH